MTLSINAKTLLALDAENSTRIRRGIANLRYLTFASHFLNFSHSSSSSAVSIPSLRKYCTVTAEKAQEKPKKKEEVAQASIGNLEIKIGQIRDIIHHPDAESLYVERIELGEAEPRTIVSGLAKYMTLEELKGRKVLVLCNLPAKPLRGIASNGMLLASANAEGGLALVEPPAEASVGEVISFSGIESSVIPNISGNKLSKILKNCHVSADGKAYWKDAQGNEVHWQTSAGLCTSKLPNSNIS